MNKSIQAAAATILLLGLAACGETDTVSPADLSERSNVHSTPSLGADRPGELGPHRTEPDRGHCHYRICAQ